ncbi:MAG TPA: DUF3048 domain-containing protein [Candidatus Dormibacteraeota bacterium]|nr:DUF3048 domain-containing protein [Candidatus Dormibacteraeota bacterium]
MLGATLLPGCWGQSISASIAKTKAGYVRINEPVVLSFNAKIDLKSVRLSINPKTDLKLAAKGTELTLTPLKGWKPAQTYSVQLKNVSSSDHSLSLSNWQAKFKTQPHAGIAGFLVDGKPLAITAGSTPTIAPLAAVTITFTGPMQPATATPTVNGLALPAAQFAWAADHKSVLINRTYLPYQTYQIGVAGTALAANGDVATDTAPLTTAAAGIEPANSSSGIPATGFKTQPALMVVVDNAGLARPQSGLQAADMVFEYISEYNISRFTLTYFNNPASTIGPVRSCRMINPYLGMAFKALTLCSGASDGTLGWLWGKHGAPGIPVIINDYDTGNHFFRVNTNVAPHNLYTDASRMTRARSESAGMGGGNYVVDPQHPDADIPGAAPAAAPSIPLQGVTYSYDGGCSCYRPFDHGTPRTDAAAGGGQIGVKNVIVMHVPFGNAGWVEDVNGGAQSIRYQMNGQGPAEIWSDGKQVEATWHMGAAGQDFYQNTTQPLYFTDPSGNLIRLNTGLTWIHVVGNGQTQ